MARCENVILESLPHGFTTLKSKKPVLQFRDSDVYEEYKTPVGSSVDIICQDTFKKITIDEVDSDPYDMKLTVMCLPTQKYDIPRENFPKVCVKGGAKLLYVVYFKLNKNSSNSCSRIRISSMNSCIIKEKKRIKNVVGLVGVNQ